MALIRLPHGCGMRSGLESCRRRGRPTVSRPPTSKHSRPSTKLCHRAMDTTHTGRRSLSRGKPGSSMTECVACSSTSLCTGLTRTKSRTAPPDRHVRFFRGGQAKPAPAPARPLPPARPAPPPRPAPGSGQKEAAPRAAPHRKGCSSFPRLIALPHPALSWEVTGCILIRAGALHNKLFG